MYNYFLFVTEKEEHKMTRKDMKKDRGSKVIMWKAGKFKNHTSPVIQLCVSRPAVVYELRWFHVFSDICAPNKQVIQEKVDLND